MDFSCETMFTLLKSCDYDARFASCMYVIVEWLNSMSLIGIICSQSEIKQDNWNGLDLYVRGNFWFSWLVNWGAWASSVLGCLRFAFKVCHNLEEEIQLLFDMLISPHTLYARDIEAFGTRVSPLNWYKTTNIFWNVLSLAVYKPFVGLMPREIVRAWPGQFSAHHKSALNYWKQARRILDSVEGGSFIFWEVFFLAWKALTRCSRG